MRKHRRKQTRGRGKLFLVIGIVLAVAIGFTGLFMLSAAEDRKRTEGLTDEPVARITLDYEGQTWYLRDEITTYLVMGTDETLESEFQYEGRNLNNKQADFIMLMMIDRKQETITALHLNRDTYMEIRRLDDNGNPAGTVLAHLNNAHSFGSGGKDSCRNVAEAVSRLLFGVPVDHYLAVTMDGIPVLANLVDGVPVQIEEDLTELNAAFVQGATVTLKGQDALRFVRSRMNVSDGTNLSRMTRQRAFVDSLYHRLESKVRGDENFALRCADSLAPYVTSDMTTNELARFVNQLRDFEFQTIYETPGTAARNGQTGYMDFTVDAELLKKQVIQLFFTTK